MKAAVQRVWLAVATSGSMLGASACGATPPGPPRQLAPTEADACARTCERLAACDLETYECRARCDEDQARLQAGVYPAYVDCLERELPKTNCPLMSGPERRGKVAVCWTATTEAWSTQEKGAAMRKVVHAICARTIRCAPTTSAPGDGPPLSLTQCEQQMDERTRGTARARALGVVKPALVDTLSTCVATAPCEGDDPLAGCKGTPDTSPETSPAQGAP